MSKRKLQQRPLRRKTRKKRNQRMRERRRFDAIVRRSVKGLANE